MPFEKMIPLKSMRVDYTYQRPIDEDRIKKIMDSWDDMRVNLIYVSLRPDGYYYVMDGNHTRTACERLGGTELPCRVFTNLTVEQEADLFSKLNTSQKKPSFNDLLRAKVAAGSELECSYIKLLEQASVPYELYNAGTHGKKIKCHHALISVYKRTTYDLMLRALKGAKQAADGRNEFYQSGLFPGLCSTVILHPEIDDYRLINVTQKHTSSQLREISDKYKRGLISGSNSATVCYRKAFIDIYNKGLKKNKIEE